MHVVGVVRVLRVNAQRIELLIKGSQRRKLLLLQSTTAVLDNLDEEVAL